MPTIIDVAVEYITPVLGINPVDDIGVAYFEERITKKLKGLRRS
jgi:hypothetical protein